MNGQNMIVVLKINTVTTAWNSRFEAVIKGCVTSDLGETAQGVEVATKQFLHHHVIPKNCV
jgi:hypothetical protein